MVDNSIRFIRNGGFKPSVTDKIHKKGYFYNITPLGLKTQALPIFYNNATPLGLKYLALNPEGVIHFFVFFEQIAKWQICTLFLLRYLAC